MADGSVTVRTALVAASLPVNLACVAVLGVRAGGDTPRYVEGAANLGHRPLEGMQRLFPGYIALLAASTAAGFGAGGVVALQIVMAAVATVLLYELGRRVAYPSVGIIAAGLFVLNVDIARWHAYILTDSLYISLVVVAAYAIHIASERGGWRYAAAAAALVAAALVRPHGRLLAIAAAVYWVARRPSHASRAVAVAAAVALIGAAAITARGALRAEAESPGRWLGEGVVIWADPESRLPMPGETGALTAAGATSAAPLAYAVRHPLATSRLAASRIGLELLHARRFYSTAHNAAVVVTLGPTYVLAVLGFLRLRDRPLAWLLAGIAGLHFLMVAATFADWDGRFLLYVLPLLDLFAAAGLLVVTNRAWNGPLHP